MVSIRLYDCEIFRDYMNYELIKDGYGTLVSDFYGV